jgi:hypothetical protein
LRVKNLTKKKKKKKKKKRWAERLADLDLECTWSEMQKMWSTCLYDPSHD